MSSGLLGPIRGKAGNKVYYVRQGKQCVRSQYVHTWLSFISTDGKNVD